MVVAPPEIDTIPSPVWEEERVPPVVVGRTVAVSDAAPAVESQLAASQLATAAPAPRAPPAPVPVAEPREEEHEADTSTPNP